MALYSQLFLRNTTSPYGDFTRNSVLSFKDLDQNFIFLKERDISNISYSSDTLTIDTLGGNSFTTTISGGTGTSLWSSNVNGIHYNSGNVGIGTNTSSVNTKLEINYSGSVENGFRIKNIEDNSQFNLSTNLASGKNLFRINSDNSGLTPLVVSNDNRVGIGSGLQTITPQATLHVYSTSNGQPIVLVEDESNPDTTPFIIDNDGYIGIGTATPTEKLDVSGNTKISGKLSVGTNDNTYIGQFSGSTGRVMIDTDGNRIGDDRIRSEIYIKSLDSSGLTVFNAVSDNPSYGVGLGIVGSTPVAQLGQFGEANDAFLYAYSEANNLHIVNGESIIGDKEDSLLFYAGNTPLSTPTPTLTLYGSGSTKGNVGIGIRNPQEKLDVSGNTKISGTLNIGTLGTGTSVNILGVDSDGYVVDGEVNVSPTTLIVNNSGDNATAEKGSLINAYDTLVYAANQSVSGDTIYVMAGDYEVTDQDWSDYGGQTGTTLYRDGVTWYFEPGSVITNKIDKTNNPILFYVYGSNERCEVYGRAIFKNEYQSVAASASLIDGVSDGGVGSEIHFECQDFDSNIFYYPIRLRDFKNADVKIHGTVKWKSSWGLNIEPRNTVEAENLNIFVNRIDMTDEDATFYPLGIAFWTSGQGGVNGCTVNFDFNSIDTVGQSTTSPQIWVAIDDSTVNIKGESFINYRTDGTSTISSLLGVRGSHNSKINIHINNCVATSLRTNKSLIMLHNNDSEETTENNYVSITGRYEALQGSVLSTNEGGLTHNSNTYVLNGEFISNTQYVATFEDDNTDVEITGELRCNYTGSTGYGIRSIVSNSNILLRDLEIVTQGADAINSSVATEIDIKGTLTTNTDVNSNVTLRGIHNLNNISQPDDLTVRGREILNETVGTITTTASTIDWSLGNNYEYTLNTGTTISFSDDENGQIISVALIQDGTGSHTVSWPASTKWKVEPTMTSTSGSTDVYTFIKINGTIYGSYIQDFQ